MVDCGGEISNLDIYRVSKETGIHNDNPNLLSLSYQNLKTQFSVTTLHEQKPFPLQQVFHLQAILEQRTTITHSLKLLSAELRLGVLLAPAGVPLVVLAIEERDQEHGADACGAEGERGAEAGRVPWALALEEDEATDYAAAGALCVGWD
jgi:hypothetical protein